jgi:nitroreductase
LVDSSAVLVFATWDDITNESVDIYIQETARQRGIGVETLDEFSGMIKGTIATMTQEQKISWAQRQAYIGLGVALVAASIEEVDSTPMEGFNPVVVNRILGLQELGLKSVALLPLGYRDSENDYLASLKKVRWDNSKFFIKK